MIIIGILAAIAIPTFLAQRERAWEAAAQSDLRNAAAAATSCSTANDGSFTACATAAELASFGFNQTTGVNYTNDAATATTWTAHTVHSLDTASPTQYDFSTGGGATAGKVRCTSNC